MKHELLVPVGNKEALIQAINAGADAVYLGGKKFGARAYADNFAIEEMPEVIKTCHLYGVKVYVTVNTLVYEKEVEEAYLYVRDLHQMGIDAVIMQDVGLINLVHQRLPHLEIHASTQMHNHNEESLRFLEDLGVSQVVFARELPLDYIENLKTNLKKEVFIHGSLCISYSGQCLFSSLILNRSGNRGECAGMCRLPYELYEDNQKINTRGNYLLSPKDLCTVASFDKLLASNIHTFKIEGRMKSAEYVYYVTKIYHDLLNNKKVDAEDYFMLQAIFNREYTTGHLFFDNDMMNYTYGGHMGIAIGKVVSVTKKKIKIKLTHEVKQFDGIRFKESNIGLNINFMYDDKDNLINKGLSNSYIYLDNFMGLNTLDEVMLTNPYIKLPTNITKKIPINMHLVAKLNKPLVISVSDNISEVTLRSNILVEESTKVPVSKDRIKEALRKVGNTAFIINDMQIEADENIFIPISIVNNLRRDVLELLKEKRENINKNFLELPFVRDNIKMNITNHLSILARTKEQIATLRKLQVNNIIVIDKELMASDLIYQIPRDNLVYQDKYDKIVTSDYASMYAYPNCPSNYHLNILNHYTVDYLSKYSNKLCLSIESSLENNEDIMVNCQHNCNLEVLVYGNVELMLMKYCPLKNIINKDNKCHLCLNNKKYYLKDRNNAKYLIETNKENHSTTILNCHKIDLIKNIKTYQKMGITNFRINLLDESEKEVEELIERVREWMN